MASAESESESVPESAEDLPPSTTPEPTPSGRRRPMLIVGAIVVLLAVVGLVWVVTGSGSDDDSGNSTVHTVNEKLCDGLPEAAGPAWHTEEAPTVDTRTTGGVDTVTCVVRYAGDSNTDGAVSLTAEISVSYYSEPAEAEDAMAPQLLPPNLVESAADAGTGADVPGDWDRALFADAMTTGDTATTGAVLRSGNVVAVLVVTIAGGADGAELSEATTRAVEAARDNLAGSVITAAVTNGESD